MTISNIVEQLIRDEGKRNSAYTDSLGYLTIGVGRLIDSRKGGQISDDEVMYLLGNDVARVKKQVLDNLPWASSLDDARFGVLLNMAFQLGISGLLGFKNTLAMIQSGNYEQAANGMLNSLWAKQAPYRASRLALQLKTGVWQ